MLQDAAIVRKRPDPGERRRTAPRRRGVGRRGGRFDQRGAFVRDRTPRGAAPARMGAALERAPLLGNGEEQ